MFKSAMSLLQQQGMSMIARNARCPCGSLKKYKLCCLGKDSYAEAQTHSIKNNAVDANMAFLENALHGCRDKYRNSPSSPLFEQMRLLENPTESLGFLYSLLNQHRQSSVLLKNLTVLLVEIGRFLEANCFCQELLKLPGELTFDNWYLLLEIASYRSDLVSLNLAMMKILHSEAPTFMKLAATLATRFCARRSDEVRADIVTLLEESKLDRYSIILLSHCIEALEDSALAKKLAARREFSMYIPTKARLRIRIDAICTKAVD